MLDEHALEEARRVLGTRTYSETVTKALEEAVRVMKIRSIPQFFGKGLWTGDSLNDLRQDRILPNAERKTRPKAARSAAQKRRSKLSR